MFFFFFFESIAICHCKVKQLFLCGSLVMLKLQQSGGLVLVLENTILLSFLFLVFLFFVVVISVYAKVFLSQF